MTHKSGLLYIYSRIISEEGHFDTEHPRYSPRYLRIYYGGGGGATIDK